MPFYTAITEEGFVSDEKKAKIAKEITRIHTTVMKVPSNFVRVIFLSYPKGSGYAAGEQACTAVLSCVLRSGHTDADKSDMLNQLWSMLQEIPSSNAMEMGQIMQSVGHK
jgi:phenylpyruvate tautomerase PptA (4-oxalocrotonate tautomerase family)